MRLQAYGLSAILLAALVPVGCSDETTSGGGGSGGTGNTANAGGVGGVGAMGGAGALGGTGGSGLSTTGGGQPGGSGGSGAAGGSDVALWSLSFGGGEHDWGVVAADAAGNALFAGGFWGSDDIAGHQLTSAGTFDAFIAKLDQDGNYLWAARYGDAEQQIVHAIASDADGNIVTAGQFWSTIDFGGTPLIAPDSDDYGFLAKLDPDGSELWATRVGPIWGVEDLELAMAAGGGIVLGAVINDPADFGGGTIANAGDDDLVVASYTAAGAHQWSKAFGGTADETRASLAVDAAGNVILATAMEGDVDFGGGTLAASGGALALVALDVAGNHVWSRVAGGPGTTYLQVNELALGADDSIHLVGVLRGTIDLGGGALTASGDGALVAKRNATGDHLWAKSFGDDAQATSCVVDPSGHVFVTGRYRGDLDLGGGALPTASGYDDYGFVAEFDGDGNHLASVAIGYPGNFTLELPKLALGAGGELFLQGKFWVEINLGNGSLYSNGFTDLFLARLEDLAP